MNILISIKQIKHSNLSIVAADSAYDDQYLRQEALKKGFILHASTNKRRNPQKDVVKPRGRWKVETTHSWFNNF